MENGLFTAHAHARRAGKAACAIGSPLRAGALRQALYSQPSHLS